LLESQPARREELSRLAKERLFYDKLIVGSTLRIQHVKPDGLIFGLSEGQVQSFEDRTLMLRRRIFGDGRYDGLDVPKVSTDYAVTLAEEGSSILRHSYYSRDGMSKGELYNISTPIEFYPETIRYVDLEIDVIRRVGELPKVIDSDRLNGAWSQDM
jgi:hypothetical protein